MTGVEQSGTHLQKQLAAGRGADPAHLFETPLALILPLPALQPQYTMAVRFNSDCAECG